jgi:hypothetical protein
MECEDSKARVHQKSDIVWSCLAIWLFPKLRPVFLITRNFQVSACYSISVDYGSLFFILCLE